MSTEVYIHLYNPEKRRARTWAGVLQRLIPKCEDVIAQVQQSSSNDPLLEVDSQDYLKNLGFHLYRIHKHDIKLSFIGTYELQSGRPIVLNMDYSGLNYDAGWIARSCGQIAIFMAERDLLDANGSDRLKEDPENWRKSRETLEQPFSDETALSDAAALFFHACGVDDVSNSTAPVEHGAMPLNCWDSPGDCYMIFHRNLAEFALDFGRIYADYHFGIRMPELLDSGVDIWSDDLHDVFLYLKKKPQRESESVKSYYGTDLDEQILHFLNRLNESTAKQLESRPEAVVRALRDFATIDSPIKVFDFGERGLGLVSKQYFNMSKPYFKRTAADSSVGLWQAYMFIMENIIGQL